MEINRSRTQERNARSGGGAGAAEERSTLGGELCSWILFFSSGVSTFLLPRFFDYTQLGLGCLDLSLAGPRVK